MNERVERFKDEAADLNRKAGTQSKEAALQAIGVVMMVAAVVVSLIAYQASLGSDDQRDIQSFIVLAVAMLCLGVAGAAIFLRYSMAKFLRFWLLRQMYEGQSHIDQVVEAVTGGGAGAPLQRTKG